MIPFKTIVIMDLETTGLPHLEHQKTKITEMSLVASLTSHYQGDDIPRVINKLTLAFNPMKMILPETSKITGLENELLEEMKKFDDSVVTLLNGFLGRLPQPLCLVAHNGNKFDFPILMKHLLKCKTKLMDNIYCADSLLAFRTILCRTISMDNKNVKVESDSEKPKSINDVNEGELEKRRMSVEVTPEKKSIPYNAHPVKPTIQFSRSKHSSASRKLNFDFDNGVHIPKNSEDSELTVSSSHKDSETCRVFNNSFVNGKLLKSYKLVDIYSYLHDLPGPNFHRSEDDCMALLSCINKCKEDFLYWLYHNAVLLCDIKALF